MDGMKRGSIGKTVTHSTLGPGGTRVLVVDLDPGRGARRPQGMPRAEWIRFVAARHPLPDVARWSGIPLAQLETFARGGMMADETLSRLEVALHHEGLLPEDSEADAPPSS